MSHIPNLLTLLRIGASPVLILLLKEHAYDIAFLIFILAGISDGLDGYIAKKFGFVSKLGTILDPLADKILIISAFVMLTFLDYLPFWLLLTVGFRDLLIIGGCIVLVALSGSVQLKPSRVSKLNTVMQLTLVTCVIVQSAGWLNFPLFIEFLIYSVLVTTIFSGANYVWIWGIKREFE